MFTKTTMYCKFMLSDDGDYNMCICMRVCTHICMYAHTFVLRMNQIYVCICNESFNFKCPYERKCT